MLYEDIENFRESGKSESVCSFFLYIAGLLTGNDGKKGIPDEALKLQHGEGLF